MSEQYLHNVVSKYVLPHPASSHPPVPYAGTHRHTHRHTHTQKNTNNVGGQAGHSDVKPSGFARVSSQQEKQHHMTPTVSEHD